MAFFILERREGNSCRDLIKVKSSCVAFVCLLLFQWMNGWMDARDRAAPPRHLASASGLLVCACESRGTLS